MTENKKPFDKASVTEAETVVEVVEPKKKTTKTEKFKVIAEGGVYVRSMDAFTAPAVAILTKGTEFEAVRGVEWGKVKDAKTEDGEKVEGYVLLADYIVEPVK